MKKIIYTCDRCKEEIQERIYKPYIDAIDVNSEDYTEKDPYPELRDIDLCQDCADVLCGKIKSFVTKGAPAVVNKDFQAAVDEMVATSQKTEDNSVGKKLDTGKILALYKAGWKAKAIAEEMGCKVHTVYDTVYRDKKKSP